MMLWYNGINNEGGEGNHYDALLINVRDTSRREDQVRLRARKPAEASHKDSNATMVATRAIEDITAINMTPGEPLVIHTAAKFEVRLRSAGNHQADLAALDELQAKIEDCQLKSRVVLELLDLPGMRHDVSMQELTEAIDKIRKEITASGNPKAHTPHQNDRERR